MMQPYPNLWFPSLHYSNSPILCGLILDLHLEAAGIRNADNLGKIYILDLAYVRFPS